MPVALLGGHPMNRKHQKVFAKTILWLTAEILLNLVGLDDFADYSEYLFERNTIVRQA